MFPLNTHAPLCFFALHALPLCMYESNTNGVELNLVLVEDRTCPSSAPASKAERSSCEDAPPRSPVYFILPQVRYGGLVGRQDLADPDLALDAVVAPPAPGSRVALGTQVLGLGRAWFG